MSNLHVHLRFREDRMLKPVLELHLEKIALYGSDWNYNYQLSNPSGD